MPPPSELRSARSAMADRKALSEFLELVMTPVSVEVRRAEEVLEAIAASGDAEAVLIEKQSA